MNRRLGEFETATPGRLGRSRIDRGHFVALSDDFQERRRRKIRRAHKDDAHGAPIASERRGVKAQSLGDDGSPALFSRHRTCLKLASCRKTYATSKRSGRVIG